jgi:hypothetical protein
MLKKRSISPEMDSAKLEIKANQAATTRRVAAPHEGASHAAEPTKLGEKNVVVTHQY